MKQVIVHPERCVGCMQCMFACAIAHSRSETLLGALTEQPRPSPRVHVGAGPADEGFPNRCRHCDPAPCLQACLPGAIRKSGDGSTVLVDYDRCINCASCAMACPYGVIRFGEDAEAPPGKTVALKCDNCSRRRGRGEQPACVEVCRTGALSYEDPLEAMKRRTAEVAVTLFAQQEAADVGLPAPLALMQTIKRAQKALETRSPQSR
ncbi:MAG: 4Fe-4S dicluster domain-containing protein [Thermoleophilia bacterium]